jgi:hypothetical protein
MPIPELHLFDAYDHQEEIILWNSSEKFEVAMMPARAGKGVTGVNKVTTKTMKYAKIWQARDEKEYHPRWNIWCIAPTYIQSKQQWLDILSYFPKELWGGEPINSPPMSLPIKHGGLISCRSADKPEMLVSEAVDFMWITEAREIKANVWSFLRQRLMSPGRVKYSGAFIEGTAGRMQDPDDPEKLQWFWAMVLSGRGAAKNPDYRSFYWFEDKARFGYLDHPILSLTPEGRAEIESMRNDPNMSEDEFRMGVLGECLSGRTGRPVIKGFQPPIHVAETQFNPRHILYRCWDFGRQYPACTFHQLTPEGTWDVHAEHCPILQDTLDVEFGMQVKELTKKLFDDVDPAKIYDYGDFECTQKQDSRRETTKQAFKNQLDINLIVEPTKAGDEMQAIEIMNARMKILNTGPIIRINPRCYLSIKGFEGNWIFEAGKSGGTEWIKESVSEIHPFIDVFDTFKYFCTHVLAPLKIKEYREQKPGPIRRLRIDADGSPLGYEVIGNARR